MWWLQWLAPLLLGAILWFAHHRQVRRLRYERDCYRTALDVLEANGYFDHKAEDLVRQHAPQ